MAGPTDALPSPEEVLLAWLLALPHDACARTEAQRVIARIDGTERIDLRTGRWRKLFGDVVGAG